MHSFAAASAGVLEKLVNWLVPDAKQPEIQSELDERLLAAAPIALERCREVAVDMAQTAARSMKEGIAVLFEYSPETAASIREKEEKPTIMRIFWAHTL